MRITSKVYDKGYYHILKPQPSFVPRGRFLRSYP
jgi:hypothetical protein